MDLSEIGHAPKIHQYRPKSPKSSKIALSAKKTLGELFPATLLDTLLQHPSRHRECWVESNHSTAAQGMGSRLLHLCALIDRFAIPKLRPSNLDGSGRILVGFARWSTGGRLSTGLLAIPVAPETFDVRTWRDPSDPSDPSPIFSPRSATPCHQAVGSGPQ